MSTDLDRIDKDIEGYLALHERKEMCRFVAVGSVDDGKSTLIGRLLHDTLALTDDQLSAVKSASKQGEAGTIDFSLFTDGLKAEREQGITIDVAYRYFSTEKRKFIIADTPGHVQYTRNMATGASTADVAIILIDARLGVLPQSRRHAYIASLLGIPDLLVAVNKMDLVDFSKDVFDRLSSEFRAFAEKLGFARIAFFPISAKEGDNVVTPSARTPWFTGGGTVLSYLETVPLDGGAGQEGHGRSAMPLRFPVQYVLRPNLDYRGFAGQIASGTIARGDEVVVLPSRRRTRVKGIDVYEGELERAAAPLSVTVRLTDEVDLSRGDMLVHVDAEPRAVRSVDAMLVWMNERPFDPKRALLLKHTSRMVPARVERVQHKIDLDTLAAVPATGLQLNDIARVTVHCTRPIFCDPYQDNRVTGAFILIDGLSNDTVAAGMIVGGERAPGADGGLQVVEGGRSGPLRQDERSALLGQQGAVLWLAGDAARASLVERALHERGYAGMVIDARELSVDALHEVASRCALAGLAVIVASEEDLSAHAPAIDRLKRDPRVRSLVESAGAGPGDPSAAITTEVATDKLAEALAACCVVGGD